jgi:hypothetical protein
MVALDGAQVNIGNLMGFLDPFKAIFEVVPVR